MRDFDISYIMEGELGSEVHKLDFATRQISDVVNKYDVIVSDQDRNITSNRQMF